MEEQEGREELDREEPNTDLIRGRIIRDHLIRRLQE